MTSKTPHSGVISHNYTSTHHDQSAHKIWTVKLHWFQRYDGQPQNSTSGRFNGICWVATVCTPPNTCFLGPIGVQIPNGITIGSAIFAKLMAESCYTLQWAVPSPLKTAHSHGGSGTTFNTGFLGPILAHNPNGISISSAIFAELGAECPYTLQWATPSSKNCPFHCWMWTPI